jgi:hypothetical protein
MWMGSTCVACLVCASCSAKHMYLMAASLRVITAGAQALGLSALGAPD